MAEKGKPPRPPRGGSGTPEDYLTTGSAQLPGADYSYTVELVGSIQNQLGQLTEAVQSLKDHSKEQSKKLDDVRMDVHGARSAGKALLWVVGLVGALLGIALAAYFQRLFGVAAQ